MRFQKPVASTSVSKAAGVMPKFVIKPLTQYIKEGETATLRCLCKGQPRPVVAWEKGGRVLSASHKYKTYVSGDFSCLDIVGADMSDHGLYSCTISNTLGKASVPVDVDVTAINTSELKKKRQHDAAENFHSVDDRVDVVTASPSTDVPHPPNMVKCQSERRKAVQSTANGDRALGYSSELISLLPSRPKFTKILASEEVAVEGENVVIEVKITKAVFAEVRATATITSSHEELAAYILPRFTKEFGDCIVTEGDAVTLECHGCPLRTAAVKGKERNNGALASLDAALETLLNGTMPTVVSFKLQDEVSSKPYAQGENEPDQGRESNWPSIETVQYQRQPRFTLQLEDRDVTEGDCVTFACMNITSTDIHSYLKFKGVPTTRENAAPPQFIIQLGNQELVEGESVTIKCLRENGDGIASNVNIVSRDISKGSVAAAVSSVHINRAGVIIKDFEHDLGNISQQHFNRSDSAANFAARKEDVTGQDQPPFFVQQLPNVVDLEEGSDLDLACHVSLLPACPYRNLSDPITAF